MVKIDAKIIEYTVDKRGNENVSYLITFPRIILAEVNTHRMGSKNTSSSRAIPARKMHESVENLPFIPIAWQKEHTGMQGTEYFTDKNDIHNIETIWLSARDAAIEHAKSLNTFGVTKQLTNRLLEPFMWVTMVFTSTRSGLNNMFELRCPRYKDDVGVFHKSKEEFMTETQMKDVADSYNLLDWLEINEGDAEIHISELAERMYDALHEAKPRILSPGEWHIPFHNEITTESVNRYLKVKDIKWTQEAFDEVRYKVATSLCARTSYTVIGSDRGIDIERMVQLYDRLISQDPPHSSPLEHCGQAMTDLEYFSHVKGQIQSEEDEDGIYHMELPTYITEQGLHLWGTTWVGDNPSNGDKYGWSRNLKGLKQLREIVEGY